MVVALVVVVIIVNQCALEVRKNEVMHTPSSSPLVTSCFYAKVFLRNSIWLNKDQSKRFITWSTLPNINNINYKFR